MSKLIDAELLQKTYCDENCGDRKCVDAMDRCVFIDAVINAPTVDAVPIGKIEKIKTEIRKLSPTPTAYDVVDGNPVKDAIWETLIEVYKIFDKYIGKEQE